MFSSRGKSIIVGICIVTGLMHFVIGPDYKGPYQVFFSGYFIDIILPLSLYLLFQLPLREHFSIRRSRIFSATGVLVIGFGTETLQLFGVPIFGNTFDPIDYFMFVLGILAGWLIDIFILKEYQLQK